jgi:hypothetical protein
MPCLRTNTSGRSRPLSVHIADPSYQKEFSIANLTLQNNEHPYNELHCRERNSTKVICVNDLVGSDLFLLMPSLLTAPEPSITLPMMEPASQMPGYTARKMICAFICMSPPVTSVSADHPLIRSDRYPKMNLGIYRILFKPDEQTPDTETSPASGKDTAAAKARRRYALSAYIPGSMVLPCFGGWCSQTGNLPCC